jgi:hypothetical protein
MMGERRMMQEALFYGFSLERHVPNGHLLRVRRFVRGSGASATYDAPLSDSRRGR